MNRVVAISSSFSHHSDTSGYKQILKFIQPVKVFGIDFRQPNSKLELSYYYIHEFKAWFSTLFLDFQILHILYGEDYFRFSRLLFPRKKLVVTFHQTPEILDIELSRGNFNGKVAGFTHQLTRRRLKKLDAALVMTREQYEVAKKYIPENKLHIVPFGIHLHNFNQLYNQHLESRDRNLLITVGNWQRNWPLFFNCAKALHEAVPNVRIKVVAKNLGTEIIEQIHKHPNVTYASSVSDEELYKLYLSAVALFLPLKGAAANNAINEALALGCPIITNGTITQFSNSTIAIKNFNTASDCVNVVESLNLLSNDDLKNLSLNANHCVQQFDWEKVSEEIMNIYKSL